MPGFTLTYNDVTLTEVNIRGYERKAVLHGPDYLYTRHTVHLQGVFNPGMAANNNLRIGADEQALERKLSRPRGELVLSGDGVEWLRSRGPDVDQGPTTLACNVVHFNGLKTYFVDWVFTTAVVDPTRDTILSLRWSTKHMIDSRFWTSIAVTGEAILRADGPTEPDALRPRLLLPVEIGYKRESLTVDYSQDRTAINFSFLDRQTPLVVTDFGISDIQHSWNVSVTRAKSDQLMYDAGSLVQSALAKTEQAVMATAFASSPRDPSNPSAGPSMRGPTAGGFSAASGAVGLGLELTSYLDRNMPQAKLVSTTTLFGLPTSTMTTLVNYAAIHARTRLSTLPTDRAWSTTAVTLSGDVRNRIVQVSLIVERSNIAGLLTNAVTAVNREVRENPVRTGANLAQAALGLNVGQLGAQVIGAIVRDVGPTIQQDLQANAANVTALDLAFVLAAGGLDESEGILRAQGKVAKPLPGDFGSRGDSKVAVLFAALVDGG